jgi:dTDP-4-amino-4,6-dideoxygalactose transaminase
MQQARVTGATAKNVHDLPGGNFRLDPLQAAILGAKLPHYEARIARRRATPTPSRQALQATSLPSSCSRPTTPTGGTCTRSSPCATRGATRSTWRCARGTSAAEVYYPVPMPLQKAVASLGHRPGDFPHAERAPPRCCRSRCTASSTTDDVARVAEAVRGALREVPT